VSHRERHDVQKGGEEVVRQRAPEGPVGAEGPGPGGAVPAGGGVEEEELPQNVSVTLTCSISDMLHI